VPSGETVSPCPKVAGNCNHLPALGGGELEEPEALPRPAGPPTARQEMPPYSASSMAPAKASMPAHIVVISSGSTGGESQSICQLATDTMSRARKCLCERDSLDRDAPEDRSFNLVAICFIGTGCSRQCAVSTMSPRPATREGLPGDGQCLGCHYILL